MSRSRANLKSLKGGKNHSQSTTDLIKENRSKIEAVKLSNKRLTEELRTQDQRAKMNFMTSQQKVDKLQGTRLILIQKIEKQFMIVNELQGAYGEKLTAYRNHKKSIAELDGKNHFSLNKKIQTGRNLNQKLRIKLNENKAEIKLQREKINQYRKERTLLDKMYSKLEITIKKKTREYKKLIEGSEDMKRRKEKLIKDMNEIKDKANNDINIIQSQYEELIRKSSASLETEFDREDHIEEDEMFDPLKKEEMGSAIDVKRDVYSSMEGDGGDKKINSMENLSMVNPKEQELSHLKMLFEKMMLLMQVDRFDELKEFYHDCDSILERLYSDLQGKIEAIEGLEEVKSKKEEELRNLKRKKKTNEEFIQEDKPGYMLASKIIGNQNRCTKLEDKNEDLQDKMDQIEYFVDQILEKATDNCDEFWRKRQIKLAHEKAKKEAELVEKKLMEEKGNVGFNSMKDQLEGEIENQEGEIKEGVIPEGNQPQPEANNEVKENVGEEEKKPEETDMKVEEPKEVKEGNSEHQSEGKLEEVEEGMNEEAPAEENTLDREQKILDEIKEKEFKHQIMNFREEDAHITDPKLRALKRKVESFKSKDQAIFSKVQHVAKLSEDLNLLTNFLRNNKVDASKINSLHKPVRRKKYNQDDVNLYITDKAHKYTLERINDSSRNDELITKDMKKLKNDTLREVHGIIHDFEKDPTSVRRDIQLSTVRIPFR